MSPKQSDGKIIDVLGLPPGWKCIEKVYQTGNMAGKTYVRFQNDKYNGILSVKKAVELDAQDRGLDVAEELKKYEEIKAQKANEKQAEREERGNLAGTKKQEAIDAFRARFGKLEGATLQNLPGWKTTSRVLERCGQIAVSYTGPDGTPFRLVNQVEALFGNKLLRGQELPDIEAARAAAFDEAGRVVHAARKVHAEEASQIKRRKVGGKVASSEDYRPAQHLKLIALLVPTAQGELEEHGADNAEEVDREASEIHRLLVEERGFPRETSLMYVTGPKKKTKQGGSPRLAEVVSGVYFRHNFRFQERPCFQQVSLAPSGSKLLCSGLYISWSSLLKQWKIGSLDEGKAGLAVCRQDVPDPQGIDEPWLLFEPSGGAEGGGGASPDGGSPGE